MALNIGMINFGVAADTRGIRRAITEISKFQKATDRLARSQKRGAEAVVKARENQSRQLTKALQQTIALRKEMLKSGAPVEQLQRLSQAFATLQKRITSGKLKAHEIGRAFDQFNVTISRSRKSLNEFNREQQRGKKGLGEYAVLLRNLESVAVLALGPLSGIGARIRSISAIIARGAISTTLLWVAGLAGALLALAAIAAKAAQVGDRIQGLRNRFTAATSDIQKGRKELAFTAGIANKLGLEMEGLGRSYSRFLAASQGTSIEGEKARTIFTQVAKAAAALKLSAADVEGVMRAVEQIMSKGTVQAEELRGQLGDRLPGAFRIAAEAMGVSTRELNRMLKAGEVVSDEFLPKFGDALERNLGATAANNLKTISGAFNVLKNNTTGTFAAIDEWIGASEFVAGRILSLANILPDASIAFDETGEAAVRVTSAFTAARNAARAAAPPIENLSGTYSKLNEELVDANRDWKIMVDALHFLGKAEGDIDFMLDFFTALNKTTPGTEEDFKKMAEHLKSMTGEDFPATAAGIAVGMAEISRRAREAQAEIDRQKAAPAALERAQELVDTVRARVDALRAGPDEAELYSKITTKVDQYVEALEDGLRPQEEINRKKAIYEALLLEIVNLEADHAKAIADANQAERERQQLINKQTTGIERFTHVLDTLREQNRALAMGPQGLEFFEKVTAPLERMRDQLQKADLGPDAVIALLKLYEQQLLRNLELTNDWTRATTQAVDAFVNGFENILVKGQNVSDMLKNLAAELLRVLVRVGVLDPLKDALLGAFKPGGVPGAGGGGARFNLGPQASTGGSFKLTGSGGLDNKPFTVWGKAGEVVTVQRQDQMAGNGGGINLTINAPGADAGTIERVREVVKTELAPQIIQAATDHTMGRLKRPRFA